MPLKIVMTGSTGLIGEKTVRFLKDKGHKVVRLLRQNSHHELKDTCLFWDIAKGEIDRQGLEGQDVVIHLAGENISDRRWSAKFKKKIYASRVDGTAFLVKTLIGLNKPPRILLSASAVGIYGAKAGDQALNEQAPLGNDFLAQLCRNWEAATKPAEEKGIRVVHMRFGVVFAQEGGMLKKILPVFKMGLGGNIGPGQQVMSWIASDEIPLVMNYLINSSELSGPVNVTSPEPVANAQFTKAFAAAIGRSAFIPLPAFMVKIIFGEMGETLLLGSQKAVPQRLLESGYIFQYPSLEAALKIYTQ